jgi:uncharacterized membrane protein
VTFLLGNLYALSAFAALLLLGRGAVYVLSFGGHARNPVYRVFCFLTVPAVRLTRMIAPAVIEDRHIPLAAFLVLLWICLGFAYWLPSFHRLP